MNNSFVFSISNIGVPGLAANEKIVNLEQKIYRLQEELTEQHRSKGEVSYCLTF